MLYLRAACRQASCIQRQHQQQHDTYSWTHGAEQERILILLLLTLLLQPWLRCDGMVLVHSWAS